MKFIFKKLLKRTFIFFLIIIISYGFYGCSSSSKHNPDGITTQNDSIFSISEQEITYIQHAWGEGIVRIGKIYSEKGDYKTAATEHINNLYRYEDGQVLFKPTMASEQQFRPDFRGALSYFIGGDSLYPEDHGFALHPWSSVRWENTGIRIYDNIAIAMGNYYFSPAEGGGEVKVEYSFVYLKDTNGTIKITLHDSHFPYTPKESTELKRKHATSIHQ